MSLRSCHAGRDPASRGWGPGTWIPAFAGMTAGAGWPYRIVNCLRASLDGVVRKSRGYGYGLHTMDMGRVAGRGEIPPGPPFSKGGRAACVRVAEGRRAG